VTSRFRSGSTLLWHLMRQLDAYVCFYEPCHDNLIEHISGDTPPQESHRGVRSYWDEYSPLFEKLKNLHKPEFGVGRLFLEKDEEYPALEQYIRFFIEENKEKTGALHFNRMDFRLPWLRTKFPNARILHLFRNPRQQWLSMVRSLPRECWDQPDLNTNYELLTWSISLSHQFPFLVGKNIQHSYERHYLIWRLSYLMAQANSDLSLNYDDDFQKNPAQGVKKLLSFLHVSDSRAGELESQIVSTPRHLESGREKLFQDAETAGNDLLKKLGLDPDLGRKTLGQIVSEHKAEWQNLDKGTQKRAIELSLNLFSEMRSSVLELVAQLRSAGTRIQHETERRIAAEAQAQGIKEHAGSHSKKGDAFRKLRKMLGF